MIRIGHGYDVHRFRQGRPCVLCGVDVPCPFGPDGHSDADVPLHALMDAMLGALAMGDIGALFPDSDPAYEGISSLKLLDSVVRLAEDAGYRLGNADITIIAQKPRLSGYIGEMRRTVAGALRSEVERVSVKATTEEGLGFTGDLSGIAAHAVVLLEHI